MLDVTARDAARERVVPDDEFDELDPRWQLTPDRLLSMTGVGHECPSAPLLDALGEGLDEVCPRLLSESLSDVAKLQNRADAARLRLMAGLVPHCQVRVPTGEVLDATAAEVSLALHITRVSAEHEVRLACYLSRVLTATLRAMDAGTVSLRHARILYERVRDLDPELAQRIEAKVLGRAGKQDPTNFARSVNRAIASLDEEWQQRSREARADVRVEHRIFDYGVGQLIVQAPAEVTTLIHDAMRAYAAAQKDGTANLHTWMVRALEEWATAYLTGPTAPTRHGRPYTVNVVVDLATLVGLADHPAYLPGIGPIPAEVARFLAAEGAPLRRLVTDPMTGHLLDYGRSSYHAPPDLAAYLAALYVHSAAPFSDVPAENSDFDHNPEWDTGGTTDPEHMTPLDRRFHRIRTFGDWTYVKHEDGSVTWTSPTGRTITVEPHDYRLGP